MGVQVFAGLALSDACNILLGAIWNPQRITATIKQPTFNQYGVLGGVNKVRASRFVHLMGATLSGEYAVNFGKTVFVGVGMTQMWSCKTRFSFKGRVLWCQTQINGDPVYSYGARGTDERQNTTLHSRFTSTQVMAFVKWIIGQAGQ